MKKGIKYLLAVIPAALVALLIWFDVFSGLDAMLTDTLYSQLSGVGNTIKLICIDEETLAEYGTLASFSRAKSAELIDVLYADKENAPKTLAFDVMFIGDTDEETDEALATAANNADHIVAATNLVYRGKKSYGPDGMPYYDEWNIETEERPFAALDEKVATGFANTLISKDGFVRTAQISAGVNGEKRYSLAAQTYKTYMEAMGQEADFSKSGEGTLQFFYSGKPGEFAHFSLKDVLDGKIPASEFCDSIVLVGAYAPGLQDSFQSAASRGKAMYGVEIHANIIMALLQGKTAKRVPKLYLIIIAAVVLLLYTILAREMKMYPALLVGVWVILAEGIIGRMLATHGYVMSLLYILLVVILVMIWVIIEKYVLETVRRKRVLNSFRKYMAPQVIDALAKDGDFHIELGGEKRHVAVLFVDIRGFTTMSEALNPEQVVQILNEYLSLMTNCIFENGGMLDKFIGDAAMAIFNAPKDQEDYVYQAVLAGLAMQTEGKKLGDKLLAKYGKTVSFGVGIHVGEAVVGNIGSESRMDYTAIGDTVNTASRIEGKAERGELLISEDAYQMLEGRIVAAYKDEMQLKGKAKPVKVYRVTGVCEREEE